MVCLVGVIGLHKALMHLRGVGIEAFTGAFCELGFPLWNMILDLSLDMSSDTHFVLLAY